MDAVTGVRRLDVPFGDRPLDDLRAGDQVLLSGTVMTGRDAAHARFAETLRAGGELPFDPAGQVIYYVGPTPARPGRVIGSAGPTTASRMDPFSPLLIERGLRGMIGKGRRSAEVVRSMREHGCVYFGAVEGTAALLGRHIVEADVVAYPDLGAEAVYRLEVTDFPVVVVNDLHGGDLYELGPAAWRRPQEWES
jgi:fumarate hydratase subunit beta